jgi:superfamily II DNA or RNA helicase
MTLARFNVRHNIVAPDAIVRQVKVEQFKANGKSLVDERARVYVASVQTLVKRMDSIADKPDIIIVDESHHLTEASTWGRVVAAYPDAKLLPVTATPCRLDGKGLGVGQGGFADDMVTGPSMSWLIEQGFLSRYRIFAPPNALDLTGVKKRMGDYATDQLAEAVDKPAITGNAVEHYIRLATGKRAVAFCVSVEHARHVAEQFIAAGVTAECLDGSLDPGERDNRIKRFESGETLVMTSCGIVNEGFDLPAIEVAIMLRPTQSLSLYLQQIGRALRVFPGKTEAIILDHVGVVAMHGLPDEDREWSLEGVKKKARKTEKDDTPDVKISTCSSCFSVHAPAPICPTCGHIYPVRERKLEEKDGELAEITAEQLDVLRRQKRIMQGQAQTVEQLMKQGMGRAQAIKVLEARKAKQDMQEAILNGLHTLEGHGIMRWKEFGITTPDIRKMKPKELRQLQQRVTEKLQAMQG